RPNDRVLVTDGGFKTMSIERGVPQPLGLPQEQVEAVNLSAEHGRVRLAEPNATLQIGDHLEFVVGYSDSTVMLHDMLYATRGGVVQAAWTIAGRGKIQ
ncbi:MAG: DSD1 family PLP-dependent enzyme, partial [Chloroflexota bacterium]